MNSYKILEILTNLRVIENTYPNEKEQTIYEILVDDLDIEWSSKEEEIIGIIYDNKNASIDEIQSLIRDYKVELVTN
jgi:hypothetical protein